MFHFLELFLNVLANAMRALSSPMLFSLTWAWPTEFPNMSIASCASLNETLRMFSDLSSLKVPLRGAVRTSKVLIPQKQSLTSDKWEDKFPSFLASQWVTYALILLSLVSFHSLWKPELPLPMIMQEWKLKNLPYQLCNYTTECLLTCTHILVCLDLSAWLAPDSCLKKWINIKTCHLLLSHPKDFWVQSISPIQAINIVPSSS